MELNAQLSYINVRTLMDELRELIISSKHKEIRYIIVSLGLTAFVDTTTMRDLTALFQDLLANQKYAIYCIVVLTRYSSYFYLLILSIQFYQHDADIYYTNRYYQKVQSIRKSIAQSAIPHDKISELFQIITDFDRTLTHPLSFQCHGLIAEFVPIPEFQSAVKPLFNFRALYPNVPPQKWWEMFHEEMIKHNITPSILSQLLAVPGRVYLREHCQVTSALYFYHRFRIKSINIEL